ncbi:hypothetical protein C943_01810 [Mariniradius saccharolyticus AK6]|uniref:Uncharacterized protein n=1 Tax=Mariniradius saccharolyticus AK6 TaxID=1239962 RepID=M7Y3P4_9BACT|nr:hypothetical protein C943_01810 [Mariniradius saccharolyticus AK6]
MVFFMGILIWVSGAKIGRNEIANEGWGMRYEELGGFT